MIAKSRKIAYYSLVFLGIFGAHRFYLKKPYAILLLINGIICMACLMYIFKVTGSEYLNLAQQLTLTNTGSAAIVGLPSLPDTSTASHSSILRSNLLGLNGMQGKTDMTKFDPLLLWANILYMITSIIALAVCAFDLFQISKWIPKGNYYDNVTLGYTVQ